MMYNVYIMHRTQIYIDEQQFQRLQLEAEKQRLNGVSELIRRAIDTFLEARERRADWGKDPLTKAVGKIRLSVTDASEKHDRYLYG